MGLVVRKTGEVVEGVESQMVIQGWKTGSCQSCVGGHLCLLDVIGMDSKRHFGKGSQNLFLFPLEWKIGSTCDPMGKVGEDCYS